MKPEPATTMTITDPRQGKLLLDSRSYRFFAPFVAQTKTASRAAAELDVSVATMLYRVTTLVAAGLLVVTRIERRAGSPIKHYRSVADDLFVPFDIMPHTDLDHYIRDSMVSSYDARHVRGLARYIREQGYDGRRIFLGDDGTAWHHLAPASDREQRPFSETALSVIPGGEQYDEIVLSDADAVELHREIEALWRRYRQPNTRGRRYLLRTLLIPLEPDA
jgi:hypothetical protein